MNRRWFIKGLMATVAAPALPKPVLPSLNDLECLPSLFENEYLIRSELWGKAMKEKLLDDLYSMLTVEAEDGTTHTRNSVFAWGPATKAEAPSEEAVEDWASETPHDNW